MGRGRFWSRGTARSAHFLEMRPIRFNQGARCVGGRALHQPPRVRLSAGVEEAAPPPAVEKYRGAEVPAPLPRPRPSSAPPGSAGEPPPGSPASTPARAWLPAAGRRLGAGALWGCGNPGLTCGRPHSPQARPEWQCADLPPTRAAAPQNHSPPAVSSHCRSHASRGQKRAGGRWGSSSLLPRNHGRAGTSTRRASGRAD